MTLVSLRASYSVADAMAAIDYAIANNINIINASWAVDSCGDPCAPGLEEAIREAGDREIVFVAAALNNGQDIDDPNHLTYPIGYTLENIIGVASTDMDDDVSSFSNFGATSVDLGAPGENIYTSNSRYKFSGTSCVGDPNTSSPYVYRDGTSFSAPLVAGAAALVKGKNSSIPAVLVKARILEGVDTISALDPNGSTPTVTGGRLNLAGALANFDSTSPSAITDLSVSGTTTTSVTLGWSATGDDGLTGAATMYEVRQSNATITDGNWLSAKRIGGEPIPEDPNTPETFTIAGLICGTQYYFALRAYDEWGNAPLSNVVSPTTNSKLCTTSYCKTEEIRCTYTGSCGLGNCCNYSCHYDESCTGADTCPVDACSCE